jgi:tRNA nucleotidyltransferase/poly(A) polymerase
MIGGTSRDFLLGVDPADFDFVTDATPEQEKAFLPEANYRFACFGSIKAKVDGVSVDITTLREEEGYADHRHPTKIRFITDLKKDSFRRDFTINALYVDTEGKVIDFHDGLSDLKNRLIRFIGDPHTRIKEDPLRILRARRFASRLGFTIESESLRAMEELKDQLSLLSPDKVLMESKKV